MNLLERTRAAQGLCTRCGRCEPYPGLLICRPCVERLMTPKTEPFVPEWRQKLVAKDTTDWAA